MVVLGTPFFQRKRYVLHSSSSQKSHGADSISNVKERKKGKGGRKADKERERKERRKENGRKGGKKKGK